MEKQRLFRADGGWSRQPVHLTPADLPALATASRLVRDYSDRRRYGNQEGYRSVFRAEGVSDDEMNQLVALCKRVHPEVRGWERNSGARSYVSIYADNTYQYLITEMMERLNTLYSTVAGLPDKVDDDQYRLSGGRVEEVEPYDFCPRLVYTIPFDTAAWEARHRKDAEIQTTDAEAKQKTAEADRVDAEARQADQKAKLMRTLRLGLLLAVVAVVVLLIVKLIKK